jgi:capsular polysaccharide biosynthesis protein
MELREYWEILRRRWWVPAALVVLTGLFSAWQLQIWQQPAPTYSATMRLLVGVLPAAEADVTAYDPRYYGWLTSEYLVDDFTEVVRSGLFAQRVSARLADQSLQVPPGAIQGSAATGSLHRILTLSFAWPDRDEIEAIATAAAAEITEDASFYFQQMGTEGAGVTLIDGPAVGEIGPGLRQRLELPLRLLLALVAGIGLVFLLDYLDTGVRDEKGVAALGLPLLGAIPRRKR